jgi:hypothetical protein
MVGSACFAVGAMPFYSAWVGTTADAVTYFVGSIFFTLAALLQVLISAGVIKADERPRAGVSWRSRVRSPDRVEWWAGIVQFVGTLWFNASTFAALNHSLSAAEEVQKVWTPDFYGSIAFLVASGLMFADVSRPWLRWRPHDLGWSVATFNLVGSIGFGISAVAAYVVPETGDAISVHWDMLGTFFGAVCFFFGALLLIPDEASS